MTHELLGQGDLVELEVMDACGRNAQQRRSQPKKSHNDGVRSESTAEKSVDWAG